MLDLGTIREHRQVVIDGIYLALGTARNSERVNAEQRDILERVAEEIRTGRRDFSLSEEEPGSKISYQKSERDELQSENRIRMTLQRFITRQLVTDTERLKPNVIDEFSQEVFRYVRAELDIGHEEDTRFSIYRGYDIMDVYEDADHWTDSCMTGDDSYKVELYCRNPKRVALVVYENMYGDPKARALLWQTDQGFTFLDRVFYQSRERKKFLDWATRKGYISQESSEYHATTEITVSNLVAAFDDDGSYLFPYLDTLCYGSMTDDRVDLSNREGEFSFQDVNGRYTRNQYRCMVCEGLIDRGYEYSFRSDIMCEDCFTEQYWTCGICNHVHDRETDPQIELDGKTVCERCYERYSRECDNCGSMYNHNYMFRAYRNHDDVVSGNSIMVCTECFENEVVKRCYRCRKNYYADYMKHGYGYYKSGGFIDGTFCEHCTEQNRQIVDGKRCKECDTMYDENGECNCTKEDV